MKVIDIENGFVLFGHLDDITTLIWLSLQIMGPKRARSADLTIHFKFGDVILIGRKEDFVFLVLFLYIYNNELIY